MARVEVPGFTRYQVTRLWSCLGFTDSPGKESLCPSSMENHCCHGELRATGLFFSVKFVNPNVFLSSFWPHCPSYSGLVSGIRNVRAVLLLLCNTHNQMLGLIFRVMFPTSMHKHVFRICHIAILVLIVCLELLSGHSKHFTVTRQLHNPT